MKTMKTRLFIARFFAAVVFVIWFFMCMVLSIGGSSAMIPTPTPTTPALETFCGEKITTKPHNAVEMENLPNPAWVFVSNRETKEMVWLGTTDTGVFYPVNWVDPRNGKEMKQEVGKQYFLVAVEATHDGHPTNDEIGWAMPRKVYCLEIKP